MQYLTRVLGWHLVARNWRCPFGELDLLYQDGNTLVIVEVRTRRGVDKGEVINAVSVAKVRQLRRLVPFVMYSFGVEDIRVDAVAVLVREQQAGTFTVEELIHVRSVDLDV